MSPRNYTKKNQVSKLCELFTCNKEFTTAKDNQRFCTDAHRQEYHKLLQTMVCPHCGRGYRE